MAPTSLDITTLVIAVVGALSGIAALVWNVAEFRLTGPRVKVRIHAAMLSPAMGGAFTGPAAVWLQSHDQRFDEPAVGVEVRNVGRFPTTIEKYEINVSKDAAFSYAQSLFGPPVPHRLEPGQKETWYLELRAVAAMQAAVVETLGEPIMPLVATAELGTGKRVKSDNSISIPAALLQ